MKEMLRKKWNLLRLEDSKMDAIWRDKSPESPVFRTRNVLKIFQKIQKTVVTCSPTDVWMDTERVCFHWIALLSLSHSLSHFQLTIFSFLSFPLFLFFSNSVGLFCVFCCGSSHLSKKLVVFRALSLSLSLHFSLSRSFCLFAGWHSVAVCLRRACHVKHSFYCIKGGQNGKTNNTVIESKQSI